MTHWTTWKEAEKTCANVGKPTLAMLVPSEDSSMDNERLASAHRTAGIRSELPANASSFPPVIEFDMNFIFGDPEIVMSGSYSSV